ncbi:MAG: hypothetical protein HPY54_06245 [Chthonomonadetes bacterium]|nr:hypothetical protein [Chthonomonadetes bacterium]
MKKWTRIILLLMVANALVIAGCQKQKAEVAEKAPPGAAATGPGTSSAPSGATPSAAQPQGE